MISVCSVIGSVGVNKFDIAKSVHESAFHLNELQARFMWQKLAQVIKDLEIFELVVTGT